MLGLLLGMTDAGIEVRIHRARPRPYDAKVLSCDATKFRNLTGWHPQIPFEKILKDLLDYRRERI